MMKTTFEGIDYFERMNNTNISDNGLELQSDVDGEVLKDLEELRITNGVMQCNSKEELCKFLQTMHNINTEQGFTPTKTIINAINYQFPRKTIQGRFIPKMYGIRAKLAELIMTDSSKSASYQFELPIR